MSKKSVITLVVAIDLTFFGISFFLGALFLPVLGPIATPLLIGIPIGVAIGLFTSMVLIKKPWTSRVESA